MASVKANAYGHGAVEIARAAERFGADYLGVAFLDEALQLRKAGIQSPILVLGFVPAEGLSLAREHGIAISLFRDDILQAAAQLPPGFNVAFSGLSYQERLSGSQAPALYAISILVVFLCLAALYESWSIPFAVMLVVPLGVLGAVLAAFGRGLSNDVYFQVGLLVTVGLSAKNAILIVEFAKDLVEQGHGLVEATLEAVRLRLRPILMTSLAFGLGVMPLALASGAGSGSQNAIGTGVLGGMLAATVLGIFFVPLFFVVVRSRFKGKRAPSAADSAGISNAGTVGDHA